jgi:small subunit ribosomal protein S8
MSMTDPIADMMFSIKNAAAVGNPTVKMPSSKTKVAIAKVLQDEGYIGGSRVIEDGAKAELELVLK